MLILQISQGFEILNTKMLNAHCHWPSKFIYASILPPGDLKWQFIDCTESCDSPELSDIIRLDEPPFVTRPSLALGPKTCFRTPPVFPL